MSFTYNGDMKDADGRAVAEFGFRIPKEQSQYVFGNRTYRTVTGYEGTFQVDAQSGELLRLTARTDRLPDESGACDASTRIEYGRARLGSQDFLLPSEAVMAITSLNGTRSVNSAVYSACREFRGDATLRFDSPGDAIAAPASPPQKPLLPPPLDIPAGLPMLLALESAIHTAKAAAGDAVKLRLTAAIRAQGRELVARGTLIDARVMRIQRNYGARPTVTLVLRLEAIHADKLRPFAGKGTEVQRFQAAGVSMTRKRVDLGTLDAAGEPNTGEITVADPGGKHVFAKGTEMKWLTARP